jgi:hypothetical protein
MATGASGATQDSAFVKHWLCICCGMSAQQNCLSITVMSLGEIQKRLLLGILWRGVLHLGCSACQRL